MNLIKKASGGDVLHLDPQEGKELAQYLEWDKLSPVEKWSRRFTRAGYYIQDGPQISNLINAAKSIVGANDPKNPYLSAGTAPTPTRTRLIPKKELDDILKVRNTYQNYVRNNAERQAALDYMDEYPWMKVDTKLPEVPKVPEVTKVLKPKKSRAYQEKVEDKAMGISKVKKRQFRSDHAYADNDMRHVNSGRSRIKGRQLDVAREQITKYDSWNKQWEKLIKRQLRRNNPDEKVNKKEQNDLLTKFIETIGL